MKPTGTTVLRVLGLVLAGVLYYVLAHRYTSAAEPSTMGALLSLAPYMAVALLMAWRSHHRLPALAIWFVAVAAMAAQWSLLRANFAWIYLLQHAGSFTLLAIAFGRTLAAGETPMISSFAQRVHGPLEAPLARYTRAVTLAWSSFFVLMAVLSLILFFAAPIATWSAFANLLTPFLIGAMFLGEYLLRLRCLPPHLRTGLLASIRAVLAGPTPDPH